MTVNVFGLSVIGHLHGEHSEVSAITRGLWHPHEICWAFANLSSNTLIFMDCIILCSNVLYCPQNKLFLKVIGKRGMAAAGWLLSTLFLKCGRCNDPVGVKAQIYPGSGNWSSSPLSNGNFYQGLSVYVNEHSPWYWGDEGKSGGVNLQASRHVSLDIMHAVLITVGGPGGPPLSIRQSSHFSRGLITLIPPPLCLCWIFHPPHPLFTLKAAVSCNWISSQWSQCTSVSDTFMIIWRKQLQRMLIQTPARSFCSEKLYKEVCLTSVRCTYDDCSTATISNAGNIPSVLLS